MKTINLKNIFFLMLSLITAIAFLFFKQVETLDKEESKKNYSSYHQSTSIQTEKKAARFQKETWLHRGICDGHHREEEAEEGMMIAIDPESGHENITLHRDGDTRSKFVSTTTNIRVASHYAQFDKDGRPCDGIILSYKIKPNYRKITDLKIYDMNQASFGGDIYNESEYLIEGIVKGCIRTYVTANEPYASIRQKMYHNGVINE